MKRYPAIKILIYILAGLCGYYLLMLLFGFPVPRGSKVNKEYYSYYKNIKGIYYISVENTLTLINTGYWGYLRDVDESTFVVLAERWAKDKRHVWCGDKLIDSVDVETFHIGPKGLAKDRYNVYAVEYHANYDIDLRLLSRDIDVESAEYFIKQHKGINRNWLRDKNYIYFNGERADVDRQSFNACGNEWYVDKDYIYTIKRDNKTKAETLMLLDSLQSPLDAGYQYLRNGKNIIFHDSIILQDVDVYNFKKIGAGKYLVNDMLFLNGKPFLRDTLDVKNTTFYFYGHIASDGNNVFYGRRLLSDIDASTFRQTGKEKFEDKDYVYTLKNRIYGEDYPFDKTKK